MTVKKFILLIIFSVFATLGFSQKINYSYTSEVKIKNSKTIIFFKSENNKLYIIYTDSLNKESIIVIDKTMDKKADEMYIFAEEKYMIIYREKIQGKRKDIAPIKKIFLISDKILKKEYKKMLKRI